MKKFFSILVLALVMVFAFSVSAMAVSFSDIAGHSAQRDIEEWVEAGYITGYEDGTFRPNGDISRADFCVIITRAFTFDSEPAEIAFTDVPVGAYYYDAVAAGVGEGYISGYSDTTFGPGDPITREQAAAILFRILDLQPNISAASYFEDSDLLTWSKEYVGACSQAGVLRPYSDNYFRPQQNLTRAEAVTSLRTTHTQYTGNTGTTFRPSSIDTYGTNLSFAVIVKNELGAPVSGATVVVDGVSRTTGDNGTATFSLDGGTYEYSVSMSGMQTDSGALAVGVTSTSKNITLYADRDSRYDLSITVRDSSGNKVKDAQVTLTATGRSEYTDEDGVAVFEELPPGYYEYTVYFDGNTKSDAATIRTSDATSTITMTVTTYRLRVNIEDNRSNTSSRLYAYLDDGNRQTISSDRIDFNLPAGTYDIRIEDASGTVYYDRSVTITNENVDLTVTVS